MIPGIRRPKRDSYGERACKTLCKFPNLTIDEAIEIHGQFGAMRSDTTHVYDGAVKQGFIIEAKYKYTLAPYLHEYIMNLIGEELAKPKLEIVATKYHKPFTEMQPIARPAGVRDIYFKSAGGA